MKTCLKRVVTLLLLVCVGVAIYNGLTYVVVDNHANRLRTQYPEFYRMDEIDSLFVGSSHTVYLANTEELTETLGESYYNMASSGQDLSLSYYIVKDAYKAHPEIGHIYCEVSLSRLMVKNQSQTATFAVTDYMDSFICKAEMLLGTYDSTKYINAFSPLRRSLNPTALTSVKELQEILNTKQKADYRDMAPGPKYKGRGQWTNVGYLNESESYAVHLHSVGLDDYSLNDIQDREMKYLQKLMDFCEKKDIELTILIAPYNECYFMYFKCYEEITDYVKAVVDNRGYDIIDLNLVKNEYLDLKANDYKNLDHVKYSGSLKIAVFLEQYIVDPDGDYYCDSLEQKYPRNSSVVAVGYERAYADSSKKIYSNKRSISSKEIYLAVDLSAISYADIPTCARLWEVQKDQSGEWMNICEVPGEYLDEYSTRFFIEDDLDRPYRMQLLNPATGELLYETVSNFDMYDN